MKVNGIVRKSPTKIASAPRILINAHNKPRTNTSVANHVVIFRLIFIACHGPMFFSRIRYGVIDNLMAKIIPGTIKKTAPIITIIIVSIYARKNFIDLLKSTKISEHFALASDTILSARFLNHNAIRISTRSPTILIISLIIYPL